MGLKNNFITRVIVFCCVLIKSLVAVASIDDVAIINKLNYCKMVSLTNENKAKIIAHRCLQQSLVHNYYTGIFESYRLLGLVYNGLGDLDSALLCHKKTSVIAIQHNTHSLSTAYTNIADVFSDQAHYDSALFYYNKASFYETKYPNLYNKIAIKTGVANLYIVQNKLKDVESLTNELLLDYQKINAPSTFGRYMLNLGTYYLNLQNNKSTECFNKAITAATIAKDSILLNYTYQAQAIASLHNGEFNNAQKKLKLSLCFFKRTQNLAFVSNSYFNLYIAEFANQKYTAALAYLDSSYSFFAIKNKLSKLNQI